MKFARRNEEDFSLQLTPLIDVVFLLLIFFMVSTAFVDFTRKLEIELPKSEAGSALAETKVFNIEIGRGNDIFVDGERAGLETLPTLLQVKAEQRSVVIRGDKNINYGLAVKVMGICKKAGIADIGLAVQ